MLLYSRRESAATQQPRDLTMTRLIKGRIDVRSSTTRARPTTIEGLVLVTEFKFTLLRRHDEYHYLHVVCFADIKDSNNVTFETWLLSKSLIIPRMID